MNTQSKSHSLSIANVLPTLMVGGMAFSCALLVAAQSLHSVVA